MTDGGDEALVPLEVVDVSDTEHDGRPFSLVMLQEPGDGGRRLPIVVGVTEGAAIARAVAGVVISRPLTHDLLAAVVASFGGAVTGVRIRALDGGTFAAELTLTRPDGTTHALDARPSDAIALAVRATPTAEILAPAALLQPAPAG
jgi:bifunctional DNase/RNase